MANTRQSLLGGVVVETTENTRQRLNGGVTRETVAAAGGTTISCTPATVLVNGVSAGITQPVTISGTPGTVIVSGVTTAITQPVTVSASPAVVLVNGVKATIVSAGPVTETVDCTPAIVLVNGVTADVIGAVRDTVDCTPAIVNVDGVACTVTSSSSSLAGRHIRRGKSRIFPPEALVEPDYPEPKPQTGIQSTLAQVITQPEYQPKQVEKPKQTAKVIPIRKTVRIETKPVVVEATPLMKLARQVGKLGSQMGKMAKEMEKMANQMKEMELEIVALKEATVESIEDEEDVILAFITRIA